jgi:integration host factor subunit beta
VDVPAKRIPYFKPSKELKDLVNVEDGAPAPVSDPPVPGGNPLL